MRYSRTLTLRNGKPCLIRSGEGDDAQGVYDSFMLTHAQTDYLLSYPEENSLDVEQEREFLVEKAESADEAELCAVVDGRIVGTAGIERVGAKEKVRHRAVLGISVEEDYWGLGIGRALTLSCVELARSAGYRQLELDVVSENRRAMGLYGSVGFLEYGRNPRGFLSKNGWQELVLMRLELDGE